MHSIQQKILEEYNKNNGVLPSFRQLAKIIGVSSTNTVAYHINQLKKHGLLDPVSSPNGVIKLTIENLLGFENKSGVFVFLKNKTPFCIGESTNIKKDVLEKVLLSEGELIKKIKNSAKDIFIAYHLISEENERKNLKNHLEKFYKDQNIKILEI